MYNICGQKSLWEIDIERNIEKNNKNITPTTRFYETSVLNWDHVFINSLKKKDLILTTVRWQNFRCLAWGDSKTLSYTMN